MRVNRNMDADWTDLRALGDHRSEFEDQARFLRRIWNRPDAIVAFGGHFSCGKSTLLSTLIETDILPVGDLPETGVPCQLRSGSANKVLAVGPGNVTRPLPWDAAAIAEQIGLYTEDGARRLSQEMPDRLDIDVESKALAPGVVWIDTPGINDDPVVTDRALDLALDADILVWVLSSRQCFSEPEVAFLDRFVAQRGAEPLAFVLNVFLPADDASSWERFNAREGPVLRERIAERMADLEVPDAPLHFLSARAKGDIGSGDFGNLAFLQWLRDVSGCDTARVRDSRRMRIEKATERLRMELAPRLDDAAAVVQAEQRFEQERQRALASRTQCYADVEKFIGDAMIAFGKDAASVANRIGAQIDADGLHRDDRYGNALSGALRAALPIGPYCDRIDLILERHGFAKLTPDKRRDIAAAIAVSDQRVPVPDTPIDAGTAGATAAVVGVGLAFFTGGLSLLVAGAAAAAGTAKGASDALKEDVARTRANIREAAGREHARLSGAGPFILDVVNAVLGPVQAALPGYGERQIAALMALDSQYRQLAANPGVWR